MSHERLITSIEEVIAGKVEIVSATYLKGLLEQFQIMEKKNELLQEEIYHLKNEREKRTQTSSPPGRDAYVQTEDFFIPPTTPLLPPVPLKIHNRETIVPTNIGFKRRFPVLDNLDYKERDKTTVQQYLPEISGLFLRSAVDPSLPAPATKRPSSSIMFQSSQINVQSEIHVGIQEKKQRTVVNWERFSRVFPTSTEKSETDGGRWKKNHLDLAQISALTNKDLFPDSDDSVKIISVGEVAKVQEVEEHPVVHRERGRDPERGGQRRGQRKGCGRGRGKWTVV